MAWTRIGKRTRRCLVKGFPFALLYMVEADEIIVTAVAHFTDILNITGTESHSHPSLPGMPLPDGVRDISCFSDHSDALAEEQA